MHAKDWILFIGTLIMGILTGMYLYFTSFVPAYVANPDINKLMEEQRVDIQITGEAYGGCERLGCAAFSVTGDRKYRYSSGAVRNTAESIETGDIPRSLFANLRKAVENADLKGLASPASKQCISWRDGNDSTYVVVFAGQTYTLDTCTTTFSESTELGKWLIEVAKYMHDPEGYEMPSDGTRGGLGGIIEEKLKENFDTTN